MSGWNVHTGYLGHAVWWFKMTANSDPCSMYVLIYKGRKTKLLLLYCEYTLLVMYLCTVYEGVHNRKTVNQVKVLQTFKSCSVNTM